MKLKALILLILLGVVVSLVVGCRAYYDAVDDAHMKDIKQIQQKSTDKE